jgi:Family of unknown function (DUF5694)
MTTYENILKSLDVKEEFILVIFGSGHTAMLELMMRYTKNVELVDMEQLLK